MKGKTLIFIAVAGAALLGYMYYRKKHPPAGTAPATAKTAPAGTTPGSTTPPAGTTTGRTATAAGIPGAAAPGAAGGTSNAASSNILTAAGITAGASLITSLLDNFSGSGSDDSTGIDTNNVDNNVTSIDTASPTDYTDLSTTSETISPDSTISLDSSAYTDPSTTDLLTA